MKTFRARTLFPVSSPPIENGMVVVDGGTICEWGRWDGRNAEDLGDVILMPGLINAHCHLDFTAMRGAIFEKTSFTRWITRINEMKRTLDDDAYLTSIESGFAELLGNGTTTVFNVESLPALMGRMPPPPLRAWWFYELIDIRTRVHAEEIASSAMEFFAARPGWKGGFGLSPHAPYTTSAELYREARISCEKYGLPMMTHLAESDEESEMFALGRGPLYEFLKKLGRNMSDTQHGTPIETLLRAGALPDGALLTHVNVVAESDWPLLRGRDFSAIHCPCCHEFFGRQTFPLARFLSEGFNVCLGTDSLASNKSLNMFEEMRALARSHPNTRPELLVDFVTRNPARAIGQAGRLGEMVAGAAADLIAIPYSGPAPRAAEAIISHPGKVGWTMIGGK